jgi:hypothetical protein
MRLSIRASLACLAGSAAAAVVAVSAASAHAAGNAPTFSKDVAPILYKRCVQCHRPGAIAPMSLISYEDARPWARAMKQQVSVRQMPPWGADPTIGKFKNDPSLSPDEVQTIAAWVDGGAAEGSKTDLPKPPTFTEGWSIGKPDLIFTMVQPFNVPADGTVPYVYITIPTNLKEDIWVRGVEFKPSDRRVVHHIISTMVEGNGQPVDPAPRTQQDRARKEIGGLGGYVPGRLDNMFEEGVARRIPAGTDIVLQMHYTTIGQAIVDQTQIGVVLAKEPPSKLRQMGSGQIPNATFAIPPGDPNYEVVAKQTINRDTYLTSMYPHMHVRGKDVRYSILYPDGHEEVVLRVPKYDFNWQLDYKLAEPKFMPKGSTLVVTAHYDNSSANRFNPDPTATVRWGEQTWEEMLIGYYGTVDLPNGPASTGAAQQ